MFYSRDFFSFKKISPPKDTKTPVKSPIPVSPSSSVGSPSPVRSTTSPPDYPFDELSKWSWRVKGKSILNIGSRVVGRRHNCNNPVVALCPGLRFVKDLAFCFRRTLRFVFKKNLAFCFKNIVFFLGSIAFCPSQDLAFCLRVVVIVTIVIVAVILVVVVVAINGVVIVVMIIGVEVVFMIIGVVVVAMLMASSRV
nr:hypothetical protein [Tanacetum cinerariifolium]